MLEAISDETTTIPYGLTGLSSYLRPCSVSDGSLNPLKLAIGVACGGSSLKGEGSKYGGETGDSIVPRRGSDHVCIGF